VRIDLDQCGKAHLLKSLDGPQLSYMRVLAISCSDMPAESNRISPAVSILRLNNCCRHVRHRNSTQTKSRAVAIGALSQGLSDLSLLRRPAVMDIENSRGLCDVRQFEHARFAERDLGIIVAGSPALFHGGTGELEVLARRLIFA
jgi:hypothetical protein